MIVENLATRPMDIAKMTFYQILKSPAGADLWSMLSLNGVPNPDQWEIHNRWWLDQKQVLHNKLGRRGDAPDWATFCLWRAKLFMHIFLDVQKIMVINISMWPIEKLIWDLTALRNILLEMKLVDEDNLTKPETFFQRIAVMGKYHLTMIYNCIM